MLFWASFIIGLSFVILGFAREKKDVFAISLFVLGIVGLIISIPVYVSDKNERMELSNKIDNSNPVKLKKLFDYSNIAKLNALGLDFIVVPPLEHETEISTILKPVIYIGKNQMSSKCDKSAIDAYNKVIKIEPMFPFSYYYLGTCKKINGLPDWKSHTDSAREIFEITTQIAGHNPNHDQALKDIKENYSK
mgnify:CR=1 FL=1